MSQSNLNLRVEKARHAVRAGVLQKIPGGYRVPSRTRPDHHIILARFFKGQEGSGYRVTCHYEERVLGQWKCPGNQMGHVCWHVLASMIAAAGKKSVAFFEDYSQALHYKNLGGKLCVVQSGDGSGRLYAVVGGKGVKKDGS